ncbi:hypothetical protein, partial [Aminobacter niigataensis]|uniref:hypothetical protein n=1 Tax=Aminobacter niigataensis TaxID=83265 RepID=UPI0031E24945
DHRFRHHEVVQLTRYRKAKEFDGVGHIMRSKIPAPQGRSKQGFRAFGTQSPQGQFVQCCKAALICRAAPPQIDLAVKPLSGACPRQSPEHALR